MSSSPRPQYFVAREDGTLTPLVAVDELPSTVQIAGVPAILSPAGTMNMVSLGLKERSSQRYTVNYHGHAEPTLSATSSSAEEGARPVEDVKVPAANAAKKGGLSGALGVDNWRRGVKSNDEPQREGEEEKGKGGNVTGDPNDSRENINSGGEESKSIVQAPKAGDAIPSLASKAGAGTKGTLGRKMYCTHWIRWGECDYTQQGCLYKHEMPDEDKLMEIGIATYPRWYRIAHPEKFGGMVTEVPEHHRRPGPAPTDQLWRGGPQARNIVPQSYEEFRSNASTGNQGATMNPPAFIISPWNGYNQFTGGFMQPQPHPQVRQQWSKAPHPRVTNADPPYVKKTAPNAGANGLNSHTTHSSTSQHTTEQGHSPPQPTQASSAHASQSTRQFPSPAARPVNAGSEGTLHGSQTKHGASIRVPAQHDGNAVNEDHSTAPHAQPNHYQDPAAAETPDVTPSSRAPSVVEETYRPLMPSQGSHQQNASNGQAQQDRVPQQSENPQNKPYHKRFFVPKGEDQFVCDPLERPKIVANSVETPPSRFMRMNGAAAFRKGKKSGHKLDKMDVGNLVDLVDR